MLKNLLYKIFLSSVLVLSGGWASLAQDNVVKTVVKGTVLSFNSENKTNVIYNWSVIDGSTGLIKSILPSRTHQSGDYLFEYPGLYYVQVFPIDKSTNCKGESLRIPINVIDQRPRAWFAHISNEYICSSNNSIDSEKSYFTVEYQGPKPWSFKISVDGAPPEIISGADEIWEDSFVFSKGFHNISPRQKTFELQLVYIENAIGLPVNIDPETQTTTIDVLPLPQTKFLNLNKIANIGETVTYSALIENDGEYEIFVPNNVEIENEIIHDTDHMYLKRLSFDITWGNQLGNKQIKLLEKNVYECAGDTIYANINIVNDTFLVQLGDDISLCVGDEYTITASVDINKKYSYLWSNGETTSSITVNTSDKYSVQVSDNVNTVSDNINVQFNTLPIVDLGDDIILKEGDSIVLLSEETCDLCSYKWSTDATTASITVDKEGDYSLSVVDRNTCTNSDEVNVKIGARFLLDLGPDREVCGELLLKPIIDNTIDPEITWMPGGSSKSILVTQTGKYCVNVIDRISGDIESDCVNLIVKSSPMVELGRDRELVLGEILDAGTFSDWTSYEWFYKDTFASKTRPEELSIGVDQTQIVTKSGLYLVDVSNDQGCVSRDEVQITVNTKATISVPTAFSPNGDGVNDIFSVKGKLPLGAQYYIIIFNRLGHQVFTSNSILSNWDGKTKGVSQDLDVYVYFIEITYENGEKIQQKGNITLVY